MFALENAAPRGGSDAAARFTAGGHQGGEGKDASEEWWMEGLRSFLDAPNEFWFDSASRELHVRFNSSGETQLPSELVVPTLAVFFDVVGGGSHADPVRNISFDGLSFVDGRPTFMEARGVPAGGDWALERLGAIRIEGSEDSSVRNCLFSRLDGNAISVNGYNRRLVIDMNEFVYLGQNAIASWGRAKQYNGTDGDYPRYTQVTNNLAHELGLIQKQSSFYFQAETAETVLANNIVFNIPRAGVNFNDGFGGGSEMRENLMFNTCR